MSENSNQSEIKIIIKFYSSLKNTAGVESVEKFIPKNHSLLDVLKDIQKELFLPKNTRLLKNDNRDLEVGLICLIDDADISIAGGLNQKLQKSVIITLISSLHGG